MCAPSPRHPTRSRCAGRRRRRPTASCSTTPSASSKARCSMSLRRNLKRSCAHCRSRRPLSIAGAAFVTRWCAKKTESALVINHRQRQRPAYIRRGANRKTFLVNWSFERDGTFSMAARISLGASNSATMKLPLEREDTWRATPRSATRCRRRRLITTSTASRRPCPRSTRSA